MRAALIVWPMVWTTNHVLGLEVVLEDGSIERLGSRSREAPGYDLRGAFVGVGGDLRDRHDARRCVCCQHHRR